MNLAMTLKQLFTDITQEQIPSVRPPAGRAGKIVREGEGKKGCVILLKVPQKNMGNILFQHSNTPLTPLASAHLCAETLRCVGTKPHTQRGTFSIKFKFCVTSIIHKSLLFLIFSFQILSAQNFVFNPHKFGVNLFAGGIDNPRFQFVDIDGDGDNDLFIFDKDEKLWFYRNINGSLRLEPNTTFGVAVGSWFYFVDIDNDGDKDCMTNGNFSEVSLFTNVGSTTSPQFQLTTSALLDTAGNEMYSERFSIPTFADIDGDGDADFFSGGSIGSISYYKNVGSPALPRFAFITSAFGGIIIQGGPGSLPKALHGASGIEFFDVDSNGVLDLFWGDLFNPSLYFLKNNGTKQIPNIALHDSTYPKEDKIKTFGFNFPQHADVDRDGKIDLMISCVFPNVGYDNFMFYKNVGTNAQPLYSLQTKNFIPMIDAGSRSGVAAADFDGDGDIDLCVSSADGAINIYQNNGTQFSPQYSAAPTSVININGDFYLIAASGDLNGDGKPDLVVGNFDGKLKTFLNTSANGLISFSQAPHPLDAFNVGQNAAPCIADIDGDGKLDVLIGNSAGQLLFLKNTGTNTSPSYTSETFFNSIDVGNDAIPFVIDVDKDSVLDLLIGNSEGKIYHYKRTPAATTKFELVTKIFQSIDLKTQSAPCIIDIDGDGDNDLLLGNGKGGLFFYENTTMLSAENKQIVIPTDVALRQNFPNPFNPATTISFSLPTNAFVSLKIFDVLGREIETLINVDMNLGEHFLFWNAANFPSGSYFYRLFVNNKEQHYIVTKVMSLIK